MVQSFFVWFLGEKLATTVMVLGVLGTIACGGIALFSVVYLFDYQRWPWEKEEKRK